MEVKEIKDKLDSSEYDFLRKNEHLGDNIILLTTGGSHSYGTNVGTSDLDIRGVAIERPSEIIGLLNFEQFENKETDTTVYGFKKFINLISNCNPNVLEMLGTKEEQLFVCSKYGRLLRDNVDIFLSRKVINAFGGYATAQLRRLENALARDNYPQPKKEEHIMNSINNQIATFEDRYKELMDSEIKLSIDKSEKEDFESEIFVDFNLSHYPLRDFKNMYSEMNNVIRDYDKLNHRNRKKDDLHLNKHSMHLIRLLITGTEILEGKGINTYREKDRELLLDIRNSKYTYDEIFEMVDEYEKLFKYASEHTELQSRPDFNKINELTMEVYRGVLSENFNS